MKPGSIVRWRGELYRVEICYKYGTSKLERLVNGEIWDVPTDQLELVEGVQAIAGIRTEVCRSFGYKLNVAPHGGAQYESRDFFCSQKAECSMADAPDVGAALYAYCRSQVMQSVKEFIADLKDQRARKLAELELAAEANGAEPYVFNESIATRKHKR